MVGKNLAMQSIVAFLVLLLVALTLQSLVLLFLGLRGAVRADIDGARVRLEVFSSGLPAAADLERLTEGLVGGDHVSAAPFSCLRIELGGKVSLYGSPCRFDGALQSLAQQVAGDSAAAAASRDTLALEFVGATWQLLLFRSKSALLALPLVDGAGRVLGSVAAERSLLPVYARLQREGEIALVYLLTSLLVCGVLFYLRLNTLFFRPLERLAQLAEDHRPEDEAVFYPGAERGVLRRLSSGVNRMFERIQADNRRLRAAVGELEAANRELEEKKDLLVRSEKLSSVGRLSAGLAHEIGNPLAIIQGYVDLLGRDDCSPAERGEFAAKAQQELDRIQALSRRLLDFARPQASAGPVAVNALVREVLAFVEVEKSFAGCRLVAELDAERDHLAVGPDALRQVLLNCLFNAADAMAELPPDQREIRVTTNNASHYIYGESLVLHVADCGPGVPDESLGEIFEPFYTTKEVGKGTGLGLFVCQTIVDGLGGTISAANRDGGGLVVRIELPLPPEEAG